MKGPEDHKDSIICKKLTITPIHSINSLFCVPFGYKAHELLACKIRTYGLLMG